MSGPDPHDGGAFVPVLHTLADLERLVAEKPEVHVRRHAWVLRGRAVGRRPDCEPLLVDVEPLARISDAMLEEAERLYQERFDAGTRPED